MWVQSITFQKYPRRKILLFPKQYSLVVAYKKNCVISDGRIYVILWKSSTVCVHIYICSWCIHMHIHVEAKGQPWMLFLMNCYLGCLNMCVLEFFFLLHSLKHAYAYHGIHVKGRTTCRNQFSTNTMWALWIRLRPSGFVADTQSHLTGSTLISETKPQSGISLRRLCWLAN